MKSGGLRFSPALADNPPPKRENTLAALRQDAKTPSH